MKWFILVFVTQFQNTLVCLTIEIQFGQNNKNGTDIFSTEWTLGPCYGPRTGWQYHEDTIHADQCCILPGRYTLTCINTENEFGWGDVRFEIGGKRYCDDFFGYKAMRTIYVEGKGR